MRGFALGWGIGLLVLGIAAGDTARADELVFKNGDRLTGQVLRLKDGNLVFKTEFAGEVTVSVESLERAETEAPVELKLTDGSRIQDRVSFGSPQTAGRAFSEIAEINPEPVAWHGALKAGLVVDRGNTESQDGHAHFNARRASEVHRMTLGLGYEGARQESDDLTGGTETTKRRYFGLAKYDRYISERLYWYASTAGERDGEADLDLRLTTGPGLGYSLIARPGTTLDLESGLSWVRERYEDNTRDTDYLAARLGWDFDHDLAKAVHFFHDGTWVPSLREFTDQQILETYTGFRFDITSAWFAEAAMRWKLNTEPASGTERRDVQYQFGVGWGF